MFYLFVSTISFSHSLNSFITSSYLFNIFMLLRIYWTLLVFTLRSPKSSHCWPPRRSRVPTWQNHPAEDKSLINYPHTRIANVHLEMFLVRTSEEEFVTENIECVYIELMEMWCCAGVYWRQKEREEKKKKKEKKREEKRKEKRREDFLLFDGKFWNNFECNIKVQEMD